MTCHTGAEPRGSWQGPWPPNITTETFYLVPNLMIYIFIMKDMIKSSCRIYFLMSEIKYIKVAEICKCNIFCSYVPFPFDWIGIKDEKYPCCTAQRLAERSTWTHSCHCRITLYGITRIVKRVRSVIARYFGANGWMTCCEDDRHMMKHSCDPITIY